jgi:O-methyltransferase involved in polyketide biosynthesis
VTDRLADTAPWIAAARVVESRRPDRLFGDLWATRLPGSDGFAALEQHSSANLFPALRTWRFDGWCTRAAAGGCQPVVLLAVTPRAAHDRARE